MSRGVIHFQNGHLPLSTFLWLPAITQQAKRPFLAAISKIKQQPLFVAVLSVLDSPSPHASYI